MDPETMEPLYDGPVYDTETLLLPFGEYVEVMR